MRFFDMLEMFLGDRGDHGMESLLFGYAEDWRNGCMFSFLGGVVAWSAWWLAQRHRIIILCLADVSVCCVIFLHFQRTFELEVQPPEQTFEFVLKYTKTT